MCAFWLNIIIALPKIGRCSWMWTEGVHMDGPGEGPWRGNVKWVLILGGSKESLSLSLSFTCRKWVRVQKMSADVRGLVVCVQSVCVTMALVVPIISKACCLCTVVIEGTSNPLQGNLLHNLLQFWNASESWCLPCKAFGSQYQLQTHVFTCLTTKHKNKNKNKNLFSLFYLKVGLESSVPPHY